MKQAVDVVGPVPKPSGQTMRGIFLDGSTVELTMKNLVPHHSASEGVYYLAEDGSKWRPVHGARLTKSGEYAGGPGWVEPLSWEDEPAEDE